MKGFTVLVKLSKFNAKNGKLLTKYENVNVIMGPKD
jgi:hypothetical protein